MASKEIIFKVTADTGNASATVKKLDDSLASSNKSIQETFKVLRDQIKGAEKEVDSLSKKYGENSKQADEARKVLGQLNNQYTELTKNNTDLSATFDDVYGSTKNVYSSMREMEKRMYELYITGKQNTQEFEDLKNKTIEYKQAVVSVDASVKQLAKNGSQLGAALQLGETVISGYGAVQGAMALVGGESEVLLETLTKLQAAQTVLNSIQQLKISLDKQSLVMIKAQSVATTVLTKAQTIYTAATTATTTAMKVLRIAMLALPILAVIAGITALVGWLAKSKDETEANTKANEEYARSLKNNLAAYQETYSKMQSKDDAYFNNRANLLKAQGASEQELLLLRESQLDREQFYREKEIEKIEQALDEQLVLEKEFMKSRDIVKAKAIQDEIEKNNERLNALRIAEGTYYNDLDILRINYEKANEEDRKKAIEKHREFLAKKQEEEDRANQLRIERQQLLEEYFIAQIEDDNVRRLAQIENQQERERQQIIDKYGQDTELLKELEAKQLHEMNALIEEIQEKEREKAQGLREAEAEAERQQFERQMTDRRARIEAQLIAMEEESLLKIELEEQLNEQELERALAQEDLTEGEKLKIYAEYSKKREELDQRREDLRKKNAEETEQAIKQTYSQGLTAIENLTDAVFDLRMQRVKKGSAEELRLEKQKFETNKKLQLAQAIMQGVQAVQAAFASGSAIPIVGAVTGPTFAALAGVASALNIAKIARSKFEAPNISDVSYVPSVAAPNIPSVEEIIGSQGNSTLTAGLPEGGSQSEVQQTEVVILQDQLELANKKALNTKILSEWGGG